MNFVEISTGTTCRARTVAQEEQRLLAIDNRAAALMLTDCSDSRTEMVLECFQEIGETICDAIAIHMGHVGHKRCAIEKARHYEQIGRLVAGAIDNHCAKEARRIAEMEINNASCANCFDQGCVCCQIGVRDE